ncbi:tRNA (N6-isopentenyl adenosine(37)-C2)-methylthiotransferase MiaB [Jiella mangrovi]|uniref:tRNA-2-methylthio-N(6)-dimethylallyladenosine synthase n=1 Tax=Jiella mangrovi TaxID=2821407 RepID=A0ABS4BJG4_9HYPH|nr:tRNA (N6-isopentenyl adenosine(37)-C2)-methylthiotransferase MiaB [Jiella mangrovi]MBP0616296.1 tRNA (N6-isopentenyl adenosine(37)-C2)-methylthiotransferase MiaB [Jiella mangrovi]
MTDTSQATVSPTNPAGSRKVFIKTYGCQMNVYDSQRMGDALASDGYVATAAMEEADLVLINTCHIREKAAEKIYSELGRIRKMKSEGELAKDLRVAVAGCVAQAEGEEIIARAPVVDLVIGPQTYHRLPEALARVAKGERVIDTDYAVEDKFDHLPQAKPAQLKARGVTAFLTVQEGCDKFCTFCVVPYTRGAEVSRSFVQIIDEARQLAEAGVREVTLLGQNVNAWHGEDAAGRPVGLGGLLFALAEIPGLERLRYTTSHPRDMNDELIAAHRDLAELMPYLHLPVQSGSDKILKAMNRRHTAEDYLRLIDRIRAARPDIALSGDFIVGFPGESDADFEATMRLIEEVGYASAFSFKYSPRPGTPGAEMDGHVEEPVKVERLARLQELVTRQQRAFAESLLGRTLSVLVEKPGRHPGQIVGRSPYLQPVVMAKTAGAIGDVVTVEIAEAVANSLIGKGAMMFDPSTSHQPAGMVA